MRQSVCFDLQALFNDVVGNEDDEYQLGSHHDVVTPVDVFKQTDGGHSLERDNPASGRKFECHPRL